MSIFCIFIFLSFIISVLIMIRYIEAIKADSKAVFNATTDGIFIHDAENGSIVDLNKAACTMFNYSYEQIKAKSVGELSAQECGFTQEKALGLIAKASDEPTMFEWLAKRADGYNFWVEVALTKTKIRSKKCILAVFRNIDQRKRVQDQLDETRNQLQAAIDSSAAGIIIAEASKGNFILANKSAMEILDFDQERNEDITFQDYIKTWRSYDMLGNALETNDLPLVMAITKGIVSKNHRLKITINKNDYKYLSVNSAPIYDASGEISGGVVVFTDISEQKKIEDSLIRNEKMVSIGGLAAGMAHEINNPLGAILQGIQNINRRLSLRDENIAVANELGLDLTLVNEYFKQRKIDLFFNGIKESGDKAAQIVTDLLSFTHVESGSKQELNIIEIVNKSISLAFNSYDSFNGYNIKKIAIEKNFPTSNIELVCNKVEIEHVLLNIIKNAANAIFNSENVDNGKIIFSIRQIDANVEITIEDNGCGIKESEIEHIFEPFYTNNRPGNTVGLGLSVAYFIVTNNHDGSIECESRVARGSIFKVILPIK